MFWNNLGHPNKMLLWFPIARPTHFFRKKKKKKNSRFTGQRSKYFALQAHDLVLTQQLVWYDPRGVLGISSDGDDRMEPKVKTQKNP